MESFENKDIRRQILEEFRKADAFYAQFKNDFNVSILKILNNNLKTKEYNILLSDPISIYAQEIINATESVIDKDRNYPEYRLNEELERIRKVVSQLSVYAIDADLISELHAKVKALIVEYFGGIFDLTANGFILLELNAKIYTHRFLVTYQNIVSGKI